MITRRSSVGLSRRKFAIGGVSVLGLGGFLAYQTLYSHRFKCQPIGSPILPKAEYALSMRMLQEQLALCSQSGGCAPDIATLYGLTAFGGYVIDKPNHDIILFGECRSEHPNLDLDDFLVAFRNTHGRYADIRGNTKYISYPGVSIDPRAEMLRELAKISHKMEAQSEIDNIEQTISEWQTICATPQDVRVIGVPKTSHFALVMLDADYRLKKITDGSEDLRVPGLISIMNAHLDRAIAAGAKQNPKFESLQSRFWFTAGDSFYRATEITFALSQVGVQLLTEDEFATETGLLKGTGHTEELSEQFACSFSSQFRLITAQEPLYRKLENLYRWMALVRIMVDENAIKLSGLDLAFLLDKAKIAETDVPEAVPGRSAVGRYTSDDFYLRMPSCGGVEIQFRKGSIVRKPPDLTDDVIGRRMLESRPRWKKNSAMWRIV